MWYIKKLIKQPDHYTGAPCAMDNKRTNLKCAVVLHNNATDVSSFVEVHHPFRMIQYITNYNLLWLTLARLELRLGLGASLKSYG